MKRYLIALSLAGVAACAQPQTDEAAAGPAAADFRATAPAPGPTPKLVAPVPQSSNLDNGLQLLTVSKPGLPLVHLQVVLRGGSAADPKDRPGLAGFVAEALKSGTTTRSAEQIADEIETLGSSLHVGADDETVTVAFTAMKDNFAAVFDVVADVLLHPAFDPKEVERVRRKRLAALAQERDDPSRTASDIFRKAIFGDHPYGHDVLGTEAAVGAITPAELRAFYTAQFQPQRAAVIVVGDLSTADAQSAVTTRLGEWKTGSTPDAALPAPAAATAGKVILMDRKNAPQSQLRIGELGTPRHTPDYFDMVMLNAILGGLFNSRINMNLREDKGYTYGARSYFDFKRYGGAFVVYTAVRTDVTGPAVKEVLSEIQRIRNEDVTQGELDAAKNRYSLSLPGYFQEISGIADMIANIYAYALPLDYYQNLPEKIRAVDVAGVRKAAEAHLAPEKIDVVVVGDQALVEPGLATLQRGAIEHVNADGDPL